MKYIHMFKKIRWGNYFLLANKVYIQKLSKIFSYAIIVIIILLLISLYLPKAVPNNLIIEIPKGSSAQKVARILKDNNLIYSAYFLRGVFKFSGQDIKLVPGEFQIPKKINIAKLIVLLTNPKNLYYHKLIIVEGIRTEDALIIIENETKLSGHITLEVTEGELLPNTYYFLKGDLRDDLLKNIKQSMNDYLDKLWQTRSPALPYKNKQEALILASIVEKEASELQDRKIVAGIFLNRLNRLNMSLQADATVEYGLRKRGKINQRLSTIPTPYNSYINKGLPPTPIANPSADALKAVFYPYFSDFVYFVADGKGTHVYAKTYDEHLRNVAKWRIIQKQAKIANLATKISN
ncbi:Endolytic transglycosylase MltG [Candidatus Hepatincolaceae symbiont of Richtersius coronifer]